VATGASILTVALRAPETAAPTLILVTHVRTQLDPRPQELVLAAVERNWPEARFEAYLQTIPLCSRKVLEALIANVEERWAQMRQETALQQELDALSQQIDYTYEEISLLHSLTQHLQLSRSPRELAALCLKRLHGLIEAAGHAIVLEDHQHQVHFIVEGRLPVDELALGRLLARFDNHDWSHPLVKNSLQQSLLGADFPGLQSFIAVPIGEIPNRRGWLISCNMRGGREFGSVEANLLGSIGAILGTHVRNIELYCEHDELLIGFVRSLVSTLDAKDPYTRGHSERVALIARRLGQQLNLPDSDLDDIYLSSLLHDLGKIGVDDRILRKPDQLTADEFRQIQQHPMIGFQILQTLKSLQHILPGVRNHHEAYNGRGYPDKLRADEIPLMARIIAVADSYDAMVSDRPYRKGMPLERLEDIFRRGANEQWDARVIDAYFASRDDIRHLCETYSPDDGNLLQERRSDRPGATRGRLWLRH
jgi:HD-GYP domain-containing protein (c-di-GMP phosphodiesterase class II)